MYKKLCAVLMSAFLTGSLLPNAVFAEEEPEENEEITETVSDEETEEEISEEIIEEEEQEIIPEEEQQEEAEPVIEEEEPESEPEIEEIPEEVNPEETIIEEETVPEETVIEEETPAEENEEIIAPAEEILPEEIPEEEPEEAVIPEEEITAAEPEDIPAEEKTEKGDKEPEIIEETVEETTEEEPAEEVVGDGSDIIPGQETQISGGKGERATLTFVPAVTGDYTIYSYNNGECDPEAILTDADGNELDTSDDDGEGKNFMFEGEFVAGVTYYIEAYAYNNYEFSYSVTAEEITYPSVSDGFAYSLDGTASITRYLGTDTEIVIPSQIEGTVVTAIAANAFSGCSNITSVTIPDTVTSIGKSAFKNCSSLASVTIPSGVQNIGTYAFAGCESLSYLYMPASVSEIGFRAFADCGSLKTAGPAGSGADYEFGWTAAIPGYAFSGCSGLTQVTIPSGITSIGEAAFDICSSLAEITLPDTVTSIGKWTFSECGVSKLVMPASLTEIGESAFEYCRNLKTAGPAGSGADYEFGWTTAVPANAFQDCRSLTAVNIPETVESIGEAAFYGCTGLTNITIPAYVTDIGEFAFGYYYDANTDDDEARIANFTITGYEGTAAEAYTIENGFSFSASEKTEISPTDVRDMDIYVYNGSEYRPPVTVIVYDVLLVEGRDYTVVYENNINAGSASAFVTGINKYSGTVEKSFSIMPKEITPEVICTPSSFTYNGKVQTPEVTLKYGDIVLNEGTDYNLNYPEGMIDAGQYTITASLKGNYEGCANGSYTITRAAQKVTAKAAASPIYAGKTTKITVTGAMNEVTFSSSNESVAAVDENGVVSAKKAGTVTITVVSAAEGNYKQKTVKVEINVIKMPAATAKVAAANKAGGINVAWKKVSGVTGYKIYRNNKLAKTITSADTLSWGDTKASVNGTKYVYKVAAYTDAGISDNSASVTIYRLDRPAISSLTNSAAGKMTVKWAKNANATGYQIQYSTSSAFTGPKTVTITSNATLSKVIGSLAAGTTYYFRFRSYKKVSGTNYYSMWSATKKLTAQGWKKVSGKWYYYNAKGAKQTGWLKLSGKWYYFLSDGSMVTGTKKIGSKTYEFDSSGVCLNP